MSQSFQDGHLGWKHRVERETRRKNSYYVRAFVSEPQQAYKDSNKEQSKGLTKIEKLKKQRQINKINMQFKRRSVVDKRENNWLGTGLYQDLPKQITTHEGRLKQMSSFQNQPTSQRGTVPASYPIPFQRLNQDQQLKTHSVGFMNDSTYRVASDPNSMVNQGHTRNAVYNVTYQDIPIVHDNQYSNAIGINNQEQLNKGFYSFGAQHTNMKLKLKKNTYQPDSNIVSNTIDKQFRDIGANIHNQKSDSVIVKPPNVVISDYTKNISDSMFTPGVYKQSNNIEKLSNNFQVSKWRGKHLNQRPVSSLNQIKKNNAYKPLYESNVVGTQAKVRGKSGEKYLIHVNNDYVNKNHTLDEDDKQNLPAYRSFTRTKVNKEEMQSAFSRLNEKRNSQIISSRNNRPQTSIGGRNNFRQKRSSSNFSSLERGRAEKTNNYFNLPMEVSAALADKRKKQKNATDMFLNKPLIKIEQPKFSAQPQLDQDDAESKDIMNSIQQLQSQIQRESKQRQRLAQKVEGIKSQIQSAYGMVSQLSKRQ